MPYKYEGPWMIECWHGTNENSTCDQCGDECPWNDSEDCDCGEQEEEE